MGRIWAAQQSSMAAIRGSKPFTKSAAPVTMGSEQTLAASETNARSGPRPPQTAASAHNFATSTTRPKRAFPHHPAPHRQLGRWHKKGGACPAFFCGFALCLAFGRQDDCVDHVDHAVGCLDIGLGHVGAVYGYAAHGADGDVGAIHGGGA